MIPSDMNLKIRSGTVGYNNKILVSDGKFSLGKNDEVNSLEAPSAPQVETPVMKSHKDSNRLVIGYQIWATTPTHGRTKQNHFFSVSQDRCNKK